MKEFMLEFMPEWVGVLQLIYIAVLLLVAKLFKEKLPILNKVILPSSLLAGFIGWVLSDQALGLFTVDVKFLEVIIYNAMGLGFIALALKTTAGSKKNKPFTTGAVIASGYLFQAFIGALIVVLLFSEYFLGTGFILALGFSQGPSLAYNIGHGWETQGFLTLGGGLGVTIAAIGFLWGGIMGVIINNYYARKNKIDILYKKDELVKTNIEIESHSKVTFFDALTTQVVLIMLIYGVVFILLFFTKTYLPKLGGLGDTFAGLFYGLNFLIGIVIAFGFKKIQRRVTEKGKDVKFLTNNYILQSISSFLFNIMITASVLVVSSASVREYLPFILIATTIGGVITYFYFKFLVRWLYPEYHHEYTVGLYGNGTGTVSTGIALVKMIDPNLEKPVVEDLVVGSGTALFFAIPLFGILALPEIAFKKEEPIWILLTFVAIIGYFIVLLTGLALSKRRIERKRRA
ncbi:hypothetical protein KHQ82_04285 [Mycoplasmatota bacterium]|nr:hypothetical protein KHQ82_04285 [Mycoplasmatota bacterium]